jgi:hypothetical protein
MGDGRGRMMRAVEPTTLLVLEGALEVAGGLDQGAQRPAAGAQPVGGRRLAGASSLVKPSIASMMG